MPFTLAEPHHSDLLIRKSRFIGCVQPIAGRAEAAGVRAVELRHGMQVDGCFSLPMDATDGFMQRLDDAAQGRIAWLRQGPA